MSREIFDIAVSNQKPEIFHGVDVNVSKLSLKAKRENTEGKEKCHL